MAHLIIFQWPNIRNYFPHPVSNDKVYVILDPCHMMKLVRNTIGDFKEMRSNDYLVRWDYFKKAVQEANGLHAGTKLCRRHLNYDKEKMRVRLAVQLLSNSVSDCLNYFEHDLKYADFKGSEETANFCRFMNDIFDLLNTRNFLGKYKMKRPLQSSNSLEMLASIEQFILYIENFKKT